MTYDQSWRWGSEQAILNHFDSDLGVKAAVQV